MKTEKKMASRQTDNSGATTGYEAEAAHTRRVLLDSLRQLLRRHAGLDAVVALASLTAALTQLGVEGTLAVMRQRPAQVGLPPRGRKRQGTDEDVARLESEVRAYATARSFPDNVADCRRAAREAKKKLRDARAAHAAPARGLEERAQRSMEECRRALSHEQQAELSTYERGRGRGHEVADRGLER